jgi:hypothetical protein
LEILEITMPPGSGQGGNMVQGKVEVVAKAAADARGLVIRIRQEDGGPARILLEASKSGHLPVCFEQEDGALTLVCVGHLYARDAKTFSVEESLPLLAGIYRESGLEAMRERIGGGMFALVLIDKTRRRLSAITDLFACMPLFYRAAADGCVLGTNQFDLSDGIAPSPLACAEYLTYGYLPFHQSLFADVRRMGPGQVLGYALDAPTAPDVSGEALPPYPAPALRIADENEAIDRLDALFSGFFSRLGEESLAAGLSGGYDSRLIASYCRDKKLRLVTFDNPQTREAAYARRVAAELGLATEVFSIPSDAPSRYVEDFLFGTMTTNSLESSHVFGNLRVLGEGRPSYIVDGFLGDTIVGGGYYYKQKLRSEPFWRIVLGRDEYLSPRLSDDVYLARMASGYGRKTTGIPGTLPAQVDAFARGRLLDFISGQGASCPTDADMMELLLYRFRGATSISGGPVTFMRFAPTLCPFYDTEIFTTCMGISKALRAGDRLYNAFYRRRFPELAHTPKENTGGRPCQGVVGYRMTYLANAAYRKMARRLPSWMQRGGRAGGSMDNFMDSYVHDEANRVFFAAAIAGSSESLEGLGLAPSSIASALKKNPILYLRYASLACLLAGNEGR